MVKIITFWDSLCKLEHELDQARLAGDKEKIEIAEAKFKEYRDICLESDKMIL